MTDLPLRDELAHDIEVLVNDPVVRIAALVSVTDGLPASIVRRVFDACYPELRETLWADIAAVLTVYDEHVPAESRGPWRDRLAALVGT